MIEIERCSAVAEATELAFTWWTEAGTPVRGTLTSGIADVVLHFGPTVEVADWPIWLRSITHFTDFGGEAKILLDPRGPAGPDSQGMPALSLRGNQARRALASLLQELADAVRSEYAAPSLEQRQAFETCRGIALALPSESGGILPATSEQSALFSPAPLPLKIDDWNSSPNRHHVRLTYPLPRVEGWLTDGCSLRLFRERSSFGLEFRSLAGDHLPEPLRPACVGDHFGPLLRFTIDRRGRGTVLEGNADEVHALRIVGAIARQVSRDMTTSPASGALIGFEGELWQHWLAALPDLLASPSAMPLDTAQVP